MATQLLAVGTNAASSDDVIVDEGSSITVALKGASFSVRGVVKVELKDDAGGYWEIDRLNEYQPALVIVAPGTYRFSRVAGVSCGVFSA